MTGDQIRKATSEFVARLNAIENHYGFEVVVEMHKLLLLSEIAAQLAELNAWKCFEMGLDDNEDSTEVKA